MLQPHHSRLFIPLKIVISTKAKTPRLDVTGSEKTWMPYHVVNGTNVNFPYGHGDGHGV